MGRTSVVVGVDSSTQSCKVEVRHAETGRLLGSGRAAHPTTTPPRSEHDPETWWRAMLVATRQATAAAGHPAVLALAVGGQQHGMVVLDRDGRVIRPAKLWNDTESAPQAHRLTAGREAEWASATGSVPVAAFTITKLAWLAEHEPAHLQQVASVLLPHDWLTHRLTGRLVTDRGDASGTGYWSPATGEWRPDLLADAIGDRPAADWRGCLPSVLAPTEAAGPLTPAAADALGLPAGIPVGPGTGDNMAAALGVGLGVGDVAVSLGTSGTVFATSDHPTADPTGAVAGFADATGRYLPLACTLNATLVTEAVARLIGVDIAELDRLATTAAAGAGGLVLVPYLAGERTPNRPDATGTLVGIRTDVGRDQLARAAFEGVVCGLLDGLDALDAAGVASGDGRLLLIGGGARSTTYRRALADLTGRSVTVPSDDQLVALGAAVQAAATLDGDDPVAVAERWGVGSGPTIEPDPTVDRVAIRQRYADARG